MRVTNFVMVGVVLAALSLSPAFAAEYVGAAKCKMCHKVEFTSWEQLPHAKAFDRLEGEQKSDPECLKCHATGGKAEFPGVQCESCHGAGSEFKSMKVMKDHDAAVAAGLVAPDENTCKSCHEKAPHEVPAFDFAAMKEKGTHEVKEKPAK